MNKWLRRFLILLGVTFWLCVMLFPVAAFRLAQNGEMTVRNTRIFLVSERTQGGVGFQSTRDVSNEAQCTITSVRYLMWEGEGENLRVCSLCSDGVDRVPSGLNSCVAP